MRCAHCGSMIGPTDPSSIRLLHIRNTRDLDTVAVSQALAAECAGRAELESLGEPYCADFG